MSRCQVTGCTRTARCAVRTRRRRDGAVITQINYDVSEAPKVALMYCVAHGAALVSDLVRTLSGPDEYAPVEPQPAHDKRGPTTTDA